MVALGHATTREAVIMRSGLFAVSQANAEKSFPNLVYNLNLIWNAITIFWMIRHQAKFLFVPK